MARFAEGETLPATSWKEVRQLVVSSEYKRANAADVRPRPGSGTSRSGSMGRREYVCMCKCCGYVLQVKHSKENGFMVESFTEHANCTSCIQRANVDAAALLVAENGLVHATAEMQRKRVHMSLDTLRESLEARDLRIPKTSLCRVKQRAQHLVAIDWREGFDELVGVLQDVALKNPGSSVRMYVDVDGRLIAFYIVLKQAKQWLCPGLDSEYNMCMPCYLVI